MAILILRPAHINILLEKKSYKRSSVSLINLNGLKMIFALLTEVIVAHMYLTTSILALKNRLCSAKGCPGPWFISK